MIFKVFALSILISMLMFVILRKFSVKAAKFIIEFVLICGIVFVIWPDQLTALSNKVGIGRGADLVLYLLCLCFAATFLGAYHRSRLADRRFTELVRAIAIKEAVEPLSASSETAHRETP